MKRAAQRLGEAGEPSRGVMSESGLLPQDSTAPAPPDPAPIELPSDRQPEADDLPGGTITLAAALQELARLLPELRDALNRQSGPPVGKMAYRLDELARALGVSRRVLERERSAGR